MRRYDDMEKAQTIADTQHNVEKNALGVNAEQLIQKLYDEKQNYDDGDFLHELIRLTFQS